jgi:hypothetical protein
MMTKMEASLLRNAGKGIATMKEMEASLVPNAEKGTALLKTFSLARPSLQHPKTPRRALCRRGRTLKLPFTRITSSLHKSYYYWPDCW